MMSYKVLAAVLVLSVSCASWAQRARSPVERLERINQTVIRVQQRADQAQQRADQVQQRVARIPEQVGRVEQAQSRLGRIPERANQAAARGLAVADAASKGRSARSAIADAASKGPSARSAIADAASNGRSARSMARAAEQRAQALVRAYPEHLEYTRAGVAVRGQVIAVDPDAASLDAIRAAGFRVMQEEVIEGLELRSVTLQVPSGVSVESAVARLAKVAPGVETAANHIHLQSASPRGGAVLQGAALAASAVTGVPAIGIIDGGVARHPAIRGPIEQRGFAAGAPAPNGHATAIASLVSRFASGGTGSRQVSMLVADVYGQDPAGGNAAAVARALGWMVMRKVPVVSIALAGPPNALLARAVARARDRGSFVLAPVGNAGPAAPPAYPASYQSVIAVTAVDSRNRLLIEAGRSPNITFTAPGAELLAASPSGGWSPVRGTSFAVPLVASRLVAARSASGDPMPLLRREATDLGPRGFDKLYGWGLLCARCR